MKQLRFILILIVLVVSTAPFGRWAVPTVSAQIQDNWVIDGDTVYIDDAFSYLSANPHTVQGSGWVEFTLISKVWSGYIDVVWGLPLGLNVSVSKPQKRALNISHKVMEWGYVERQYVQRFDNITAWVNLGWDSGQSPDIGNRNNAYLVRLDLGTGDNATVIKIAFNNYTQHNTTSATFRGNYDNWEETTRYVYYDDWVSWDPPAPQTVTFPYAGVSQWHIVQLDQYISAGQSYKVRCWLTVPFTGLDKATSKYVWAVKPQSQTLQEAISSGHLYLLDPWLTGGWDYRLKFTVDSGDVDADLTNFPILLELSATAGYNSDNITFIFNELIYNTQRKKIAVTNSSGSQCYVEIEKWDNSTKTAWLHVNAASVNATSNDDFYLYYDKDHADNTDYIGDTNDAVVDNVWDSNYKAVYHLRDGADSGHIYDSSQYDIDGTKREPGNPSSSPAKISDGQSHAYILGPYIGTTPPLHCDDTDSELTIETWYKGQSDTGYNQAFYCHIDEGDFSLSVLTGTQKVQFGVYEAVSGWSYLASAAGITIDGSTWYHLVGTWKKNDYQRLYLNSVNETPLSMHNEWQADANVNVMIGSWTDGGYNANGLLDELRISNVARSAAWIKATYQSGLDHLVDWGTEETPDPPTVVTLAATNIEAASATLNGNVTTINDTTIAGHGFVWDTSTHSKPDKNTAPAASAYANYWTEQGSWATGTFDHNVTALPTGTTIYYRAAANNSLNKWGYGDEATFLTKPAAPTDIIATNGTYTDTVVINWTKSTGATDYQVYRDGTPLGWAGDVATYNDTGADAPTITPGASDATDGASALLVTLTLSGQSASNGTAHVYKVRAKNESGESEDSTTDTGWRGTTGLAYQWMRSWGDAALNYSDIGGATTNPYDDTEGVVYPDGRYYVCTVTMSGATSQNSTCNRGFMATTPTVASSNATGITALTAILHGDITDTGGNNAGIRGFQWGLGSGNYTEAWNETGDFGAGAFESEIAGLPGSTTIFWRAFAANVAGQGNSSELNFTTLNLPSAPTNFTITQTGLNSINITWAMGIAANRTIIRVSATDYPEAVPDAYFVYNGTQTYIELDGLTLDTLTYYYSAWGENDYGDSLDHAEAQIGTTPAGSTIPDIAPGLILAVGLSAFAMWKRGWIRIILSSCIIIWGVFAMSYDIKIAAPLLGMGTILFIMEVTNQIKQSREQA